MASKLLRKTCTRWTNKGTRAEKGTKRLLEQSQDYSSKGEPGKAMKPPAPMHEAARGVCWHSDKHASGSAGSAMCVQSFDDSQDFAIRITYRISLRSSSLREPRHPLLKGVPSVQCVVHRTGEGLCPAAAGGFPSPPAEQRPSSPLFRFSLLRSYQMKGVGGARYCAPRPVCVLSEGPQRGGPSDFSGWNRSRIGVVMILPQVHLRKPCYDFTFL